MGEEDEENPETAFKTTLPGKVKGTVIVSDLEFLLFCSVTSK
jgi:hypothetical protein